MSCLTCPAVSIRHVSRPPDPELRDRLLAAATAEFSDRGFAGATMAGIGRRAGVTKGGVYFHFGGKEELFFAVLDHWRERLRGALAEAEAEGHPDAASRLRALLRAFLAFHFRYPQAASLLRVLATELRSGFTAALREDLRHTLRSLRARIRALLADGVQDGSLYAGDPAFVAFLLAAAAEGVVHQWLAAPREAEAFCEADGLAEALVAPHATGLAPRPRHRAAEAEDEDFRPAF